MQNQHQINNFFEFFGLSVQYRLDLIELRNRYFTISKKTHPDRLQLSSEEDKNEAMRYSSQISQAFKALQDPIKRMEHLLTVSNVPESNNLPEDFLSTILMLNEDVDDALSSQNNDDIMALSQQIQNQYNSILFCIDKLSEDVYNNSTAIRENLNSIKYYQRLLEKFDTYNE